MDDGAFEAKNVLARGVVAWGSGNMISSLDEQARQRNKDMKARFKASHATLIAFLLVFAFVMMLAAMLEPLADSQSVASCTSLASISSRMASSLPA